MNNVREAGQQTEQHSEAKAGLPLERLAHILERIATVKAGVIGDACLDVYWESDMRYSELSRETPHYTLPVRSERYSPGAGANVAANLKALGCAEVHVCSILGDDWRGGLLKQALRAQGIDDAFSVTAADWCTPAYCKPVRVGLQGVRQEDARLDFQNYEPPGDAATRRFIERLDAMAAEVDVIAVTDQFTHGVIGEAVRSRLRHWAQQDKIILVDSRSRIRQFDGVIVKPNELEALRSYGLEPDDTQGQPFWHELARRLASDSEAPCVMTLGGGGSIWADGADSVWAPSLPVSGPIDIVGAGDSFAAGLLTALGAGCASGDAMRFAHYVSGVTIRKLGTTGTASPDEIRRLHQHIAEETNQ